MRQWTRSALAQVDYQTQCWLIVNWTTGNWMKFESEFYHFHSRKYIWNCRQKVGGHFFSRAQCVTRCLFSMFYGVHMSIGLHMVYLITGMWVNGGNDYSKSSRLTWNWNIIEIWIIAFFLDRRAYENIISAKKTLKRNSVSITLLVLSHDSSNDVSQENVFWEHVFCENHIRNNVKGLQFQRDSTLQAAFLK